MSRRIADSPEIALFPRYVPEEWSGTLEVSGEYEHTTFEPGKAIRYALSSQHWRVGTERGKAGIEGTARADGNGVLKIPFRPDTSGEWLLTIGDSESEERYLPAVLGLYAVPAALEGRRPFIGELHCHSTGSDGRQEPAYVPIRARQWGMDFLALTDHWNYSTSVRMTEQAAGLLGRGMLLLRGEEMHPERSQDAALTNHRHGYHFVSVGTPSGVLDAMRADPDRAEAEIAKIETEVSARGMIDGIDRHLYAEAVWKSRTSRAMGGLVLFCHPYWAWPVNLDDPGIEQSFRDREFDAVEVISRADDSSLMQNRWCEEVRDRGPLPVVGVSDNHSWGPDTSLTQCTFVLARELTQEAIFEAIRSNHALAYEASSPRRLAGPSALVEIAEFTFLRILPLKRRLTEIEAALAFSGLRGDYYDRKPIEAIMGEQEALDRRLWAN